MIKLNVLALMVLLATSSCNSNNNNTASLEQTYQPPMVIELTQQQKDSIKLESVKQFFGNELYQKGWLATEHSYSEDRNTSANGVVRYTNPSIDESELIVKLNSDHTCEFTFKPIRYTSIVKKKAHWGFGNENEILLNENVFAKVPVTNADFPLSEEPFFEYCFISKRIKLDGKEIVLDQRHTSRSHFFIQFEIAKQSGDATNDEKYAYKILNELSFDSDMLTQYLNYYGY
jgi:hypothetical protein